MTMTILDADTDDLKKSRARPSSRGTLQQQLAEQQKATQNQLLKDASKVALEERNADHNRVTQAYN